MDPTLVVRRKGFLNKNSINLFPFTAQNNNYMLLIKFPTFLGFTTRHPKKKSLPCVIQKSDLRPSDCREGRPQNNKQISYSRKKKISWEAYLRIHFWIYKNQSVYKYTTKTNKFAINWMDLRFLFCFALLLLLPPIFFFLCKSEPCNSKVYASKVSKNMSSLGSSLALEYTLSVTCCWFM